MTKLVLAIYDFLNRRRWRNVAEPLHFYHDDHLGSAAYLTDRDGHVVQTLAYLPYGEDWVEQNGLGDTSRLGMYRYNGKERDGESGYHYYGARYYWSELWNGWLSVDPMVDKYPGVSPYAYCVWNPVKLVDPDGMKFDSVSMGIVNDFRKNTVSRISGATSDDQRSELQSALNELSILESSDQLYHIEYGNTNGYNREGETGYDSKNDMVCIIMAYSSNTSDLAHELKHAYQFEVGELSFDSRSGGYGILYDISDEMSAYKRSGAYGGNVPNENALKWQSRWKNRNGSYTYPFLSPLEVRENDIGEGRTTPRSIEKHEHVKKLHNNIFRYNHETYKR